MNILVGAREFVDRFEMDVARARDSVAVQTTALVDDAAGWALARALSSASHLRRRRVFIDCDARRIASDMLAQLRATGVQLRFSHPASVPVRRPPVRNHKKSVIIDGRISYFGGVSFTDHNFARHDMMIRCDDARVANALTMDFQASWRGRHRAITGAANGIEIMTTDGRADSFAFERIFSRIAAARASIVVHSPCVTSPFFEHLRRAAARGVRVVVITSSEDTVASVGEYIASEAERSCFELYLTPGMSRLKALLIDDDCLIAGSSSFDYLSCRLHQEVIALITEPAAIAEFKARVLAPDLRACMTTRRAASTFAGPLVGVLISGG
jgi:cardiolipin synthase